MQRVNNWSKTYVEGKKLSKVYIRKIPKNLDLSGEIRFLDALHWKHINLEKTNVNLFKSSLGMKHRFS